MGLRLKISFGGLGRRGKAKITFRTDCKLPYFDEKEPWYLRKYIEEVKGKYGEPEVVERPSTAYKFKTEYNVIYPVGGGIFINALSARSESGYTQYIVIQPPRPPEQLLKIAEEEIAARIPEGVIPSSPQEKACLMLDLTMESMPSIMRRAGSLAQDGIPPDELGKVIVYHVIRDKISVGALEPFIRDPFLEDISCSGLGNIFIIHKIFGPMESSVGFKDEDELNAFLISLAEKIGKPLSSARPIVDATLPDGSRINIVYGSDVSLRGSNFTIRKVSKTPLSVTQLINWGTFDARVAAYVWMLLREGMSGFVCGETASGKTTSLTAMLVFIRPSAKIVSIEDTAEVVVPHPNWTRELTRDTGKKESSVTMFDLLRAALRQRPNYIIVGEIRGAEGNIAFQAMQTGHPVLSTFHAADIDKLIQRLTNEPINVPKTNIDSLNFAWFQSAVYT
ncbi:MAG: type II/IV secretion system ATPase subunit, partial [Desulfurococcales archaeon]|nr:type II/IV secretion system ATPase subunit [Desulfurococcales archaeon]